MQTYQKKHRTTNIQKKTVSYNCSLVKKKTLIWDFFWITETILSEVKFGWKPLAYLKNIRKKKKRMTTNCIFFCSYYFTFRTSSTLDLTTLLFSPKLLWFFFFFFWKKNVRTKISLRLIMSVIKNFSHIGLDGCFICFWDQLLV